jgi:hypothetical protein
MLTTARPSPFAPLKGRGRTARTGIHCMLKKHMTTAEKH